MTRLGVRANESRAAEPAAHTRTAEGASCPERWRRAARALAAGFGIGVDAGRVNPSFSISLDEARAELRAMRADPKPLRRPVVICTGFMDPGFGSLLLRRRWRGAIAPGPPVVTVTFFNTFTLAAARHKLDRAMRRLAARGFTEIDLVGTSMGGLMARDAAAHACPAHGLRVARLFTLATPHRGTPRANAPQVHGLQALMRPGSDYLHQLDAAPRDYTLRCYTRLHDWVVGHQHAAPPGVPTWWVATPRFDSSHGGAFGDPRLAADLLRHLRHEPGYTHDPPTPLPPTLS